MYRPPMPVLRAGTACSLSHIGSPTVFEHLLGDLKNNHCPLPSSDVQSFPCPVFSWLSIILTLQICDFTILLLLELGILLAMGLQSLTMFKFQAIVLQLQVNQLLLDIFMLVLNTKSIEVSTTKEEKSNLTVVKCYLRACLMSCLGRRGRRASGSSNKVTKHARKKKKCSFCSVGGM